MRASAGTLAALFCVVALSPLVAEQNSHSDAKHDHLQHNHFAEFAKVSDRDRAKPNPLASDPDAPRAGKKLFAQHCAECHGRNAEGSRHAPSLRAVEVHDATPGTLFSVVSNGVIRRGMPVWSKLPEPQRWQIVTYLQSLPRPAIHRPPQGQ